jgi:hypothetical protein
VEFDRALNPSEYGDSQETIQWFIDRRGSAIHKCGLLGLTTQSAIKKLKTQSRQWLTT